MVFQIVSVVVPILLFFLVPVLVKKLGGNDKKHLAWLGAACILFFVSWYLPSPLIDGQDTSFTTHFVGGGVFTGLLWYYLKQSLRWKTWWLTEAFSLFALVSALGVANELFEIILYKAHVMRTIADTSWDLLANTFGALTVYAVYAVISYGCRHR